MEFTSLRLAVFDNAPPGKEARSREPEAPRREAEEARIALRCTVKELQLVDSFVSAGEYPTRSELMRAALHAFLRSRALSTAPNPPVDADGLIEVPIRLKPEEYATLVGYAQHFANGTRLSDVIALIFRHGESEMEVHEKVLRAREKHRAAAETRSQVGALSDSGRDLERRGVVGR
jgi:Arc/MetJ-type ribon-helix-helix transcriptional regulator